MKSKYAKLAKLAKLAKYAKYAKLEIHATTESGVGHKVGGDEKGKYEVE